MNDTSLLRNLEYKKIGTLSLNGRILDLGGSRKSGYHELIKGTHEFVVANLNPEHGFDINLDLENRFPLDEGYADNILLINVLEHIYSTHNVIAESFRVMKSGGFFVSCTPFMHHIHDSPDDYHRFTASAHSRMLEEAGFLVERIEPLGYGLASILFQTVAGVFPLPIRRVLLLLSVRFDKMLLYVSKSYRALSERIPLGYFVVARKP